MSQIKNKRKRWVKFCISLTTLVGRFCYGIANMYHIKRGFTCSLLNKHGEQCSVCCTVDGRLWFKSLMYLCQKGVTTLKHNLLQWNMDSRYPLSLPLVCMVILQLLSVQIFFVCILQNFLDFKIEIKQKSWVKFSIISTNIKDATFCSVFWQIQSLYGKHISSWKERFVPVSTSTRNNHYCSW